MSQGGLRSFLAHGFASLVSEIIMADDDKGQGHSPIPDRTWILWFAAVVLAAFIIFAIFEFWGDDEATAPPPPPSGAAAHVMPSASASAAAPAESAKEP